MVVEPPAAFKRTQSRKLPTAMSALHEFDPVADATSYLADDIPVPYYPDQEPETDWMATKLEAVEDFLREQEVYSPLIRRTQPDPEPATATSTAKGKERARSPAVKTESATACDPPPALSRRPQPAAQEALASAMQPIATPVGPAFPANQAPFPDYLALTPSEIDRLLHDARPFRYRFVYTPDHIRGIADNILRELSAFLSFYAPALEQEAAARIYLYRAFQSHFNRRL
ncbi:hypothetical protein PCASD_24043 [Puccinia coronata f. sp. avenae]|uniref:Uncharacterized protein n=1 Tax=Puccinia coronata f. sp. avenae TaxID=200324 RepID=A0A2N5TRR9_9BASI|nr:hypothetical protein PCASD_24043 [Puccinia coronata f. sp. avenae]